MSLWTPDANRQALVTSEVIAQDMVKVRREEQRRIAELARAMLPHGPRLDAFIAALAKSSTHYREATYPKSG